MSVRRDHDVVSPDGMYVPASYAHGMWAGDTLSVWRAGREIVAGPFTCLPAAPITPATGADRVPQPYGQA